MRRQRLLRLAAVLAAAIAVVAVLIVVSQGGDDGDGATAPAAGEAPAGAAEVARLFRGIPQRGVALGDPNAPVTMVEFADLQCPFCGQYARDALPTIVERYVRTGKVRLELRLLRFLGPDSVRAAQTAMAAAAQSRLWQFSDLFFSNQGEENSGYVTDEHLRALANATPGLDVDRALSDSASNQVEDRLAKGESVATKAGIDSTPSFVVGRTGGKLDQFQPSSLVASEFADRFDELLRQR
jgi:protein-disulfide isomerase